MPRMYQILKTQEPELKSENVILLPVASAIQQKDVIEKIHNGLLGFLKESLNNYNIELKVEVGKSEGKKDVIYTAADKYNYLAKKNDLLNELKNKFNLDLE